MSEVTLPIADVDEAVANAEAGETVEVYATLKIKSKTDSEIVAEISDVEKCEDMEEGGDMESDYSDSDSDEDSEEMSDAKPMKKGKKGMGILIMIGGPKKK
jgi:hypothetical protein